MASLMEEFINVLEEENRKYAQLVELSRAKTQTIIHANIDELTRITTGEQEIIDELVALEEKRGAVRRGMADVLNKTPQELTLLNMAEMFSSRPEEKEKLLDLRERIRLTLIEVAKVNSQNETLLRQAMEMLEFDMTLVKSMKQAPSTNNYNRRAYNTDSYLPSSGFDAKR